MESFEFKFIGWWFVHKNQQIPTKKKSIVSYRESENLVEFSI